MRRWVAGALSLAVTIALVGPGAAELYQWTDGAGVLHYTSDPATIPEIYREAARDIGSPRVREAPARDGLLGRDVLDFFTLTVDSSAGRATLIPR